MPLSFLKEADLDLQDIYRYSVEQFGFDTADRYYDGLMAALELIAANPRMGRERRDLIPGIRMHGHKAHVIFYRVSARGEVIVARILSGAQDWAQHLR